MLRLSIIVPFLNVEHYISKCIESLLNQDIPLKEYEIILIDDGSSDRSCEIAESFIANNSNIKLYTQDNIGVGAARNKGIRESHGSYLLFVDSDDYIETRCLNKLLSYIEHNELDLLRFAFTTVRHDGLFVPKRKSYTHSISFNKHAVDGISFLSDNLGWGCYAWQFMIKASFIKSNQLFFNETIYFEDIEWLTRTLMKAKKIVSIEQQVYYYLQRSGSIMQSVTFQKKNKFLDDKIFVLNILKTLAQANLNNKVSSWCYGMITLIFMGMLSFAENELPKRKSEIINMLNEEYYPLKSYRFTFKQWYNLIIININPYIYCYLKKNK